MKKQMTLKEFQNKYYACNAGVLWAEQNNIKTNKELWEKIPNDRGWLIWIATRKGVLTDKEFRLFACFYARLIWSKMIDERSRKAVEVAERHADGKATDEELKKAYKAAREVLLNQGDVGKDVREATEWAIVASIFDDGTVLAKVAYGVYSVVFCCGFYEDNCSAMEIFATWLRANTKPCFNKV